MLIAGNAVLPRVGPGAVEGQVWFKPKKVWLCAHHGSKLSDQNGWFRVHFADGFGTF